MEEALDTLDRLVNSPYYIIDILPRRVPDDKGHLYSNMEKYLLQGEGLPSLEGRFLDFILRLYCFHPFEVMAGVTDSFTVNPDPSFISGLVHEAFLRKDFDSSPVSILLREEDALIHLNGDSAYMTLYNPGESLLEEIKVIASACGLLVWDPKN